MLDFTDNKSLIEEKGAVILSQGSTLRISPSELKPNGDGIPNEAVTLEAAEREHVLRPLHEARWVVGEASGAAVRRPA